MKYQRSLDYLGRIAIPKDIRKRLGVVEGEALNIELVGDNIIITKESLSSVQCGMNCPNCEEKLQKYGHCYMRETVCIGDNL